MEALATTLRREVTKALRGEKAGAADGTGSLVQALQVLREMKAAGHTWQYMADRVERDFGTRLDKDQLKALVR